jgi:hypothetical protein
MITCRELADNLAEVLAEELPPERLREIDSHLEVCPPCVALLLSYRITFRLARRLPPLPLPAPLLARLETALRAEWAP